MNCYTYLIKCLPTGQVYYGVRYANTVPPAQDLWYFYFSSSKFVHKLIMQYGKDAFLFEIRQQFNLVEKAIAWEEKVLTRMKVLEKPALWLNRCISKSIRYKNHPRLGIKLSDETKQKISISNKGRRLDECIKKKLCNERLKRNNWNFGKKWDAATIEKNRNSNKRTSLRKLADPNYREFLRLSNQKLAKTYRVLSPDNIEVIVTNITNFCKENQLHSSNLLGPKKYSKGWRLLEKELKQHQPHDKAVI